jgi:hypothetical protein
MVALSVLGDTRLYSVPPSCSTVVVSYTVRYPATGIRHASPLYDMAANTLYPVWGQANSQKYASLPVTGPKGGL